MLSMKKIRSGKKQHFVYCCFITIKEISSITPFFDITHNMEETSISHFFICVVGMGEKNSPMKNTLLMPNKLIYQKIKNVFYVS